MDKPLTPTLPFKRSGLASTAGAYLAPLYVACLVLAEAVALAAGPLAALVVQIVLFVSGMALYVVLEPSPRRSLFPALALLPLLRLLALVLSVKPLAPPLWHLLVALPLGVGVMMTARLIGLKPADMGLRSDGARGWWIAASGIPLGLLVYLIVRPAAFLMIGVDVFLLSMVGLVLYGLMEELILRGVLQHAFDAAGVRGWIMSAGLGALLYAGTLSPGFILLMLALNLAAGWAVRRTGSVWGVAVAHGLVLAGFVLFWPYWFV